MRNTKRYIRLHLILLLIAGSVSILYNYIILNISYLKNIFIEFPTEINSKYRSPKRIKPFNIHSKTGQQITLLPVSGQKFKSNIPLHSGSFLSYVIHINLS